MSKAKVTLVDLTLVGASFCPVGYGEVNFDTIKQAKAWLKDKGYLIDLNLTHMLDSQGATLDVYTKRRHSYQLDKAYLERV